MTDTLMSSRQLSIKINDVLNHLGVSDEIRRDRRNCYLQLECLDKIERLWLCRNAFYFGSQSEGTTTLGLNSDRDLVHILDKIVVITDEKDDHLSEDMYTFRMDKFTNKGYCCVRDISYCKNTDVNKFWQNFFTKEYRKDNYLTNSFHILENVQGAKTGREGPAIYLPFYGVDYNIVEGFNCTSWPREVSNTFLLNQEKLSWPSDQLLQEILQSRCFVVPKGRDTGPDSDIEWRLSFSCGERLLMFDLNIVQVRCYVLLKYIKTTLLDNVQDCKGIISSYICKTVLFHTVSQTHGSNWVEDQLLLNFNNCLCNLRAFIDQKNCPHFIMPFNNLLENKLNEVTRVRLLEELQRIIESNGRIILEIKIDEFGKLLTRRDILNKTNGHNDIIRGFLIDQLISTLPALNILRVSDLNDCALFYETKLKKLHELYRSTPLSDDKMRDAIKVFVGMYSTLVGSLLASDDIKYRHDLSDKAFQWLLLGMMCTDRASAHLKLASILFLIGDFDSTFILLNGIEKNFDGRPYHFLCVCKGGHSSYQIQKQTSQSLLKKTYTEIIRVHITSCVIYSLGEINCCPKELQYEFFRAFFNEKPHGCLRDYNWLDCAIIPQVPFFHFMQYKLYKKLGKLEKCYKALDKLHLTNVQTHEEFNKNHLETVYNLIGQCMEQEGRFYLALHYYYRSLQMEPTYNAAKILICCNLCQQLHRDKMS